MFRQSICLAGPRPKKSLVKMVELICTCRRMMQRSQRLKLLLLFTMLSLSYGDSDEISDDGEFESSAASIPAPPPTSGRRNAVFDTECKKKVCCNLCDAWCFKDTSIKDTSMSHRLVNIRCFWQFGEYAEHDGSAELSCTCRAGFVPVNGVCVDAKNARKVRLIFGLRCQC